MKCPFCAEEIQDAATLCRFCGASKTAEGVWLAPRGQRPTAPRVKGAFTIKLAGAFFLLSGAVALMSISSDVALLGVLRRGVVAFCYNAFFAALFVGMGFGLIFGRKWGYRLLFAGTAFYSVDRIAFAMSKATRDAYVASSGLTGDISSLVDLNMIDRAVILATLVSLVCWWGFALYVYARRAYFE